MAKNTSIVLGDHFESFIHNQINEGKFSSASEVVRAALRNFEHEEALKARLIQSLEKGENSGFDEEFNPDQFITSLHDKHLGKR